MARLPDLPRSHDHFERLSASFLGVFLLVLSVLIASALVDEDRFGRTTVIGLFLLTVVVSFRAAHIRQSARRMVIALGVLGGVVAIVVEFLFPGNADIVVLVVCVLLVVASQAAILIYLVRLPVVNRETVMGALCIYLLEGIYFGLVYGIVDALTAGPFFQQVDTATSFERLYFSFVTITTVGYGDFSAVPNIGRALAATEALIGQFYLVVVVAQVIAKMGSTKKWAQPIDDDGAAGD